MKRCGWARSPAMIEYHDREWGVPVHDDRVPLRVPHARGRAGRPSWETILRKREAYRNAFAGFDPVKVARFTAARRERLMQDAGIVRNRLKIDGTVTNAAAFRKSSASSAALTAPVGFRRWQAHGEPLSHVETVPARTEFRTR